MADAIRGAELTVVMPVTRPHHRFFGEALESMLEQTSSCWRLIIVTEPDELDDVRSFVTQLTVDPRIAVVPNVGRRLAGAINTGTRLAESAFVALLLADDRWHPSAVATLSDYIANVPAVDFFHSGRQIIDEDGAPISSVHPAKSLVTLADFATGTPVKHLLCWRRSKAVEVGGLDERSRSIGPDDLDFPWTMAEHGALFGAVGACLYLYRDHRGGERLTTHVPLSIHLREMRRIFRKHHLDEATAKHRIEEARVTFLRQCLYRSRWSRAAHRLTGRSPRAVWRDSYR